MVSVFLCGCWLSLCRLQRIVCVGLLPRFWLRCLFFWYLVLWALSIFRALTPYQTSFVNIFSLSVGCLFILQMVSFAVQKLLSLIGSHLFIFAFVSLSFGVRATKTSLKLMPRSSLPMVSFRSFMVSSSYIKILDPFYVNFCTWCKTAV